MKNTLLLLFSFFIFGCESHYTEDLPIKMIEISTHSAFVVKKDGVDYATGVDDFVFIEENNLSVERYGYDSLGTCISKVCTKGKAKIFFSNLEADGKRYYEILINLRKGEKYPSIADVNQENGDIYYYGFEENKDKTRPLKVTVSKDNRKTGMPEYYVQFLTPTYYE